jgi:hypothetical protein
MIQIYTTNFEDSDTPGFDATEARRHSPIS